MKANLVLLAEDSFQQRFQEWHDAICHNYGFMPDNHGIWPHVSLKMPFLTADICGLETYFQEFAAIMPFLTLTLTGLELWTIPANDGTSGILFLNVAEQEMLHKLHEQLNQGLAQRFHNTQAPFDGADFHFHLTLLAGGASAEVYREILEVERQKWPLQSCRMKALAMAFQDTTASEQEWQFKQL